MNDPLSPVAVVYDAMGDRHPEPVSEALTDDDRLEKLYAEQADELSAGGMRQRNAAFAMARDFAALARHPVSEARETAEALTGERAAFERFFPGSANNWLSRSKQYSGVFYDLWQGWQARGESDERAALAVPVGEQPPSFHPSQPAGKEEKRLADGGGA